MDIVETALPRVRAIAAVTGTLFASVIASGIIAFIATTVTSEPLTTPEFFLRTALPFTGFVIGGLIYVAVSNHSIDSYIDIDGVMSRDSIIKGVGFGVVCSVIFLLFSSIATFLNIPVVDVGDELGINGELNRVVAFVFIVFLFNAPAEEFLYRNIIQKRLTASYRDSIGIVIATLIFMSVHIPTYLVAGDLSTHGVSGMVFPLLIITLLGGVLGWVYYQTEDLWVPIITHAVYNVSQLIVYVLSSGVV